MKTEYVAGFLFSQKLDKLILIEKQKPAWQKDRLNAVGGKIEGKESAKEAMVREFKEEAGVDTIVEDWKGLCNIGTEEYSVAFFYAVSDKWIDAKTIEDERILTIDPDTLELWPIIDNLKWLVPLAMDKIKKYSGKITF